MNTILADSGTFFGVAVEASDAAWAICEASEISCTAATMRYTEGAEKFHSSADLAASKTTLGVSVLSRLLQVTSVSGGQTLAFA